ncbi:MAG: helix-turn-helix transcriptional regulator [Candidatus Odinarchaeota archaeon]
MPNQTQVCNQILLILDQHTCHGYEIRRRLTPLVGDVEITTLYRWLHQMEKEGLIASTKEPGPHGPARRVYRLGERGERALRQVLRDSLGVLLHFFDDYRRSILEQQVELNQLPRGEPPPGPTLAGILAPHYSQERSFFDFQLWRMDGKPLYVLGDVETTGVRKGQVISVKGEPWDVVSKSDRFGEVWFLGVPPREKLPRTAVEAKRILKPGGIFRLNVPFAFFDEPQAPTLEAFIRITASHLFPELGVFEGRELQQIFEQHFPRSGVIDIIAGNVQIWGLNIASD